MLLLLHMFSGSAANVLRKISLCPRHVWKNVWATFFYSCFVFRKKSISRLPQECH